MNNFNKFKENIFMRDNDKNLIHNYGIVNF